MENKNKNFEPEEAEAVTELAGPPATTPLTPNQIEKLKELAGKAEENWDRYVRQTADFDNYKKRAIRERQDAVAFANEALLSKLLPVLDAFEMAIAAAPKSPDSQSLQQGVTMIASQLRAALADAGLEEIESAGKPFDPNFHEAVSQQETNESPEGHVVRQIRKGYRFRNRLLRPAGVIVAKKPAA